MIGRSIDEIKDIIKKLERDFLWGRMFGLIAILEMLIMIFILILKPDMVTKANKYEVYFGYIPVQILMTFLIVMVVYQNSRRIFLTYLLHMRSLRNRLEIMAKGEEYLEFDLSVDGFREKGKFLFNTDIGRGKNNAR
jgi:hypothetical protein